MASQYEISRADQIVDVRPWGTRTAEALADPLMFFAASCILIVLTIALPLLMVFTIPIFLVIYFVSKNVSQLLPMRYPPGIPDPEAEKGETGDGIWIIGNMEFSKKKKDRLPLESLSDKFKEVWGSDDGMRKHLLVLGSTGSGKSELLKGIFFCALCWGSGFFIADGKADNKLPLDVYNMALFFGRVDDFLVLNFLLAGKTPKQIQNARTRRTNKLNPVSTADADTIIQMGANLLPKAEGDGKQWQEKALNCWRGYVPALCWLRDNEALNISITTCVDYLALPKLEELYAKGYTLAQANGGIWNEGFIGLKAYLDGGLPGFKGDRALRKYGAIPTVRQPAGSKPEPLEQEQGVYDQHGYRATQLNPALNLLDKTFGHIFQDKFSEIDMVDVTLNNRILALLIPSLERSSQEAESLGKLTVACLRIMMGKNLGADIEGTREAILESKATEARYPYVVALDELGYYFADGIAVMFAQARSLGFAMIAAAQDIEKLTEGSRAAEAGAMLANQVTKLFMRTDDANKTNEMIQKYLGKANVALKETYEYRDGTGFKRMPEVKLTEIPVATLQNLQALEPGNAIINTEGKTFKIRSFYVGAFLKKYAAQEFHVNRFLQVRELTDAEILTGIDINGRRESISISIDSATDPLVKGMQLKLLLTGEEVMPDLRKLADAATYSVKHDKSLDMINAVANFARSLPPNVTGAQRAILLYRAARKFLLENKVDAGTRGFVRPSGDVNRDVAIGSIYQKTTAPDAEAFVLPGQAALVAAGASENALTTIFDPDPLDFLNEHRSLERKSASAVMASGSGVLDGASLVAASKVLSQADSGQVGGTRTDDRAELVSASSEQLPDRLLTVWAAAVAQGVPLDFSRFVSKPNETNASSGEQQAADDAQWIGMALTTAVAGLATKGDTVVGFTEKTKASFMRLEAALGNTNPGASTAAVEQLVAQQTTPTPLDISNTGADLGDIDHLMGLVEASMKN